VRIVRAFAVRRRFFLGVRANIYNAHIIRNIIYYYNITLLDRPPSFYKHCKSQTGLNEKKNNTPFIRITAIC